MASQIEHVLTVTDSSAASCACGGFHVQAQGSTPRARVAAMRRAHKMHRAAELASVVLVMAPAAPPAFALGATA